MSIYEQAKKLLHNALLAGHIDINFYHSAIKELDNAMSHNVKLNYTDLNMPYVPVVK